MSLGGTANTLQKPPGQNSGGQGINQEAPPASRREVELWRPRSWGRRQRRDPRGCYGQGRQAGTTWLKGHSEGNLNNRPWDSLRLSDPLPQDSPAAVQPV